MFVDFCDFLERVKELKQKVNTEVRFVADLVSLFDEFGFKHSPFIENYRNPLHATKIQLLTDQKNSIESKELYSSKYLFVLSQLIAKNEQKLEKYQINCSTLPQSMSACDLSKLIPEAKKYKLKKRKINTCN
jgi:DNA/RNA endonuclease G (NUC1)